MLKRYTCVSNTCIYEAFKHIVIRASQTLGGSSISLCGSMHVTSSRSFNEITVLYKLQQPAGVKRLESGMRVHECQLQKHLIVKCKTGHIQNEEATVYS